MYVCMYMYVNNLNVSPIPDNYNFPLVFSYPMCFLFSVFCFLFSVFCFLFFFFGEFLKYKCIYQDHLNDKRDTWTKLFQKSGTPLNVHFILLIIINQIYKYKCVKKTLSKKISPKL